VGGYVLTAENLMTGSTLKSWSVPRCPEEVHDGWQCAVRIRVPSVPVRGQIVTVGRRVASGSAPAENRMSQGLAQTLSLRILGR